jgi:hypothetical protein
MVLFAVISARFDAVSSRAQYMDVDDWTKYVPYSPMKLKGMSRAALVLQLLSNCSKVTHWLLWLWRNRGARADW